MPVCRSDLRPLASPPPYSTHHPLTPHLRLSCPTSPIDPSRLATIAWQSPFTFLPLPHHTPSLSSRRSYDGLCPTLHSLSARSYALTRRILLSRESHHLTIHLPPECPSILMWGPCLVTRERGGGEVGGGHLAKCSTLPAPSLTHPLLAKVNLAPHAFPSQRRYA